MDRRASLDYSRGSGGEPDEDDETAFRRHEYEALRTSRSEDQLTTRGLAIDSYDSQVQSHFARVTLVDKLRETRALAGFNRVFAESQASTSFADQLRDRKRLLWKDQGNLDEWLPAYTVFGEGIFLELDTQKLQAWEQSPPIGARVERLVKQHESVRQNRHPSELLVTPRYVLIHSLERRSSSQVA